MRFTKMQGAGNDYVYVDCFQEPMPENPAELARRVSDRHFGVGGDGLILICPSTVADARMRMFNADGSEAEMCGNGVRCVAKYVYDHGIVAPQSAQIETGRGVLDLELEIEGEKVRRVAGRYGRTDPGAGQNPRRVSPPVRRRSDRRFSRRPVHFDGQALWLDGRVWMGSANDVRVDGQPHVVFFCRSVASVPLGSLGPLMERQPIFPHRINVHFVQIQSPREVRMRTWERGSGETLACGTGACAVCVAGVLTGRTERNVLVHLPGGDLELEWAENGHVFLTGPAVEVFSGEVGEMMNDDLGI